MNWVSPAAQRHMDQARRDAGTSSDGRDWSATTADEFAEMRFSDRVRLIQADPDVYRRLADGELAASRRGGHGHD